MKSAFVNYSLHYLTKNNACSEKQVPIFRYTLESLYSLITKTSVILLLSIFFKTFFITFITILLYSLLRGFAFGIHATKNIYCWMISLTVYIVGPFFIKYFTIPIIYLFIGYGISLLSFLLWAPSDTPSRPLFNRRKRITNKIITLSLTLCYIGISLLIKNSNFYEIVCFLLLLETISICPLTYQIFHIPYRNYKNYKK